MTRVLHVLGSLERGGLETWLLDLLEPLDRSEWQFDVCTIGPAPGRYAPLAQSRGSGVLRCPVGTTRNIPALQSFASRLYQLLRAGRYHVVHSHVQWFSSLILAVARAARVPIRVAHSHNTWDEGGESWRRILYHAAASVLLEKTYTAGLACSSDAAAALFGRGWQGDPRNQVVPYGLNGRLHAPDPNSALRGALGIDSSATVLGHVGRFDRQKNHDFLLETALAVRARQPAARLLLVGDGARRPEIQHRSEQLGLADTIVFAGLREDVPALMSSAMDAFLLPSLYEGLPLALLEAQAAGLRCLASARISREAAAVDGAVEFLPLEAGPEVWADHALDCCRRGRLSRDRARRSIEARGLTIERSLESLLSAYRRRAEGS